MASDGTLFGRDDELRLERFGSLRCGGDWFPACRCFSEWRRVWVWLGWMACVRLAGFLAWSDEPESLILAQSERWRHA